MVINKTRVPGCLKIYPRTLTDDRKWITQTYSWDELRGLNVTTMFKYDGEMCMRYKNTFRGMYYQKEPRSQVMLMHCVRGSALIVVVNINKRSKSYLTHQIFECSETNQVQIYAAASLAVGFLALEDDTKVLIKSDQPFDVKYQRRLRWDDPEIGIKWPPKYEIDSSKFIISMRDRYADTAYKVFRNEPDAAYEPEKLYAAEENGGMSTELMDDICGPMPTLENQPAKNDDIIYPPDAPVLSNLSISGCGLTLSWRTDFFSQGYVVMRRSSPQDAWEDIVTLPRGCCMYTDFDVATGNQYWYTVRSYAYGRNRSRKFSSYDVIGLSASLSAAEEKPKVPEIISAKVITGGVMVKWYRVDVAQGYYILRANAGSEEWSVIGMVPHTSDSFFDTAPEAGKGCMYRVQAYTYTKCLGDCQERGIRV